MSDLNRQLAGDEFLRQYTREAIDWCQSILNRTLIFGDHSYRTVRFTSLRSRRRKKHIRILRIKRIGTD